MAWPGDLPVRPWRTDDLPDLKPLPHGAWTTLELDQTNAVSPDPPSGAPLFERMVGVLQASDFGSWKAVSAAAYPLYERAATLKPDSPLRVEAARIKAASADPKAQALAALKLVEGQTRYFFIGLNAGGFTPAPADLTWTRRFGDCKGKTVVLLALLKQLGIKAEAALVNTVGGDGLDRIGPRYQAFDHVIVRAEIAGHVYWLDGTRSGDEDLDIMPVPNDHWALPLRAEGADLEPLRPRPPSLPLAEIIERIDARAGIDKPAIVHKEMIARGDGALFLNLSLKQASSVDRDKALKLMLTSGQDWLKPAAVAFTYDPLKMEARASLEGTGLLPFTSAVGASSKSRDWMVDGGSIDADQDLTRLSDYHREAPYVVNYPAYAREEVEVRLPDGGKGFEVFNGGSIDTTVGGTTYARAAAIVDGRLTVMTSTQAVAPTFPARDAAAIQAALRNLSSYDVSIRYAPPSATEAAASNAKTAAETPAATARTPLETGQAAFADKDYARAEAAFTAALTAAPSAKLYYDRAAARVALGKDALAQADLQAALKLDPKDSFALFALGRLGLRHGDLGQAAGYFAAAAAASPKPDAIAERIAKAYDAEGRYADAVAYWDRAAEAAATPEPRAFALSAGCWSRARAGVELDRALKDCDASLKLHPNASSALDARALAELRAGSLAKALADYDAALTRAPDAATSLYGRALAESKLGQSDKAAADLAKAREIDPGIDAVVGRWGLAH
jgi:tetratricopeptide (TPR) repeat protein